MHGTANLGVHARRHAAGKRARDTRAGTRLAHRPRQGENTKEMVRMGCLKPMFRLCCGCCVKKKASLRSQGATYTKVSLSVVAAISLSVSLTL